MREKGERSLRWARRRRWPNQMYVVCGAFVAAVILSMLSGPTGHTNVDSTATSWGGFVDGISEPEFTLVEELDGSRKGARLGSRPAVGRRLLAIDGENGTGNCTPPAIREFPKDAFTNDQRKQGAVILHLICVMYMFYALVIVCDDYFVPSLEKISEWLNLDEDVAGATFMAAGSSAPELFTSVIGVFITKGDVGVGTIVGSAVFNVLCIIGVCGLFAEQVVRLTKWSLCRDTSFYVLSVIALIAIIYDGKVSWWESLFLVILYAVYIILMKYNVRLQKFIMSKIERQVDASSANANSNEMEDVNPNQDGDMHRSESTLMVDELLSSTSRKLDFSEAGFRIMITRHFEPRTRLRMASRMLINERQRLLRTASSGQAPQAQAPKYDGNHSREVNTPGWLPELDQAAEKPSNPLCIMPVGLLPRIQWIISWPLTAILAYTVPDSTVPRWEKFFLLSFLMSTLWIALFSYLMVWMVTVIGYTFGIPDVIMGITFLAAGTSVPDCMASLIVAKQGMGDMAISNSNGSNIFDILIGLGLPWVVQTLLVDYGSTVKLNSRGLIYSVILLLASVSLAVLGIHVNKWKLDKKLGMGCIVLYVIFVSFSVLIEYNVFTFVNLPMCKDG
uniref:sodium/potassium/calcium exchanger 3-like n=1 Tax=Myxine glutinosa TaxID=7769 RepID=UPI00358E42CC